MPTGKIFFVLRTASGALPINNGTITVFDERGNTVFYELLTAANGGISREATLETPSGALSLESDEPIRPYAIYNVLVRAEGNYRMEIDGVQLFENTVTQLPIELIPLPQGVASPEDVDIIIIKIPEHVLRTIAPTPTPPEIIASAETAIPAVNIDEGVYIPETVTVHLGVPDEAATNVTVSFIDYIKNVASSEIYPTWPRESLKANILAQISLALNRIYTEWYRSRGYDFDITSTTAFDQAFVLGRNLFEQTSDVVDDIFNNYLVRPNRVEPLFASYCNGTTTTCAGLSQWGTVALAENGQTAEDIVTFYYGDVSIEETNDIRAPEESFPGQSLSEGDTGDDVRIIQEQLNRIAINFPQLPLTEVNGIFNAQTANAVREFQRLFVLPITGIVDRATWYRISQIYSSVKRLAELTSEGQRATYNQQLYPGTPLSRNSKGSEVQEIQFYLQRISRFNPMVQSVDIDGVFGLATENAVISFQSTYGLSPTGIVDEAAWNRIVEVYNGTLDNVDEPSNDITPVPYPDFIITEGSSGEYQKYIQQILNVINNVFLTIPEIVEDGIFGSETRIAVNAFAAIFGLPQNGTVDKRFWDKMNSIYMAVAANCIFSTSESEGARGFSGNTLAIGASGENVRYIQSRINRIYDAIPYVGELETDGQYGALTANSVGALQRVFGLDETRVVDESTWLLANYIVAAIESGCLPTNEEMPVFAKVNSEKQAKMPTDLSEIKAIMRANGIHVGHLPFLGLKSRIALARWQSENNLPSTGEIDAKTVEKLLEKGQ